MSHTTILFLLFLAVATASAAIDPLAANVTVEMDELQLLLAGGEIGFVNRSTGERIFNETRYPARADPPYYHLMKNDTMFRDFQNLAGPVNPIPIRVNDSWNEPFFERLIRDWW
jgi:hypothetical protein